VRTAAGETLSTAGSDGGAGGGSATSVGRGGIRGSTAGGVIGISTGGATTGAAAWVFEADGPTGAGRSSRTVGTDNAAIWRASATDFRCHRSSAASSACSRSATRRPSLTVRSRSQAEPAPRSVAKTTKNPSCPTVSGMLRRNPITAPTIIATRFATLTPAGEIAEAPVPETPSRLCRVVAALASGFADGIATANSRPGTSARAQSARLER